MNGKLSYGDFLRKKEKISSALEDAIYKTLAEMGEDIKGISWFSSRHDEYAAKHYDIAC
jgi:hypothetical protein